MKNLNNRNVNGMPCRLVFSVILILLSFGTSLQAQNSATVILKGVVVDQSQDPLVGANVYVKSTSRGTVANTSGEFSLEVVPGEIIVFSYVGHQIREYVVPVDVPEKLTIQLEYHADIVAELSSDALYTPNINRKE